MCCKVMLDSKPSPRGFEETKLREPVAEMLKTLSIQEIDPGKVKAFQAAFHEKALNDELHTIKSEAAEHIRANRQDYRKIITIAVLSSTIACLMHIALCGIALSAYGLLLYWLWKQIGCSDRSLILNGLEFRQNSFKKNMRWRELSFDAYVSHYTVSNYIKEIVQEMKVRLPEARFTVEYFNKDPFLRIEHSDAGCKDERRHVFAWNEKGLLEL